MRVKEREINPGDLLIVIFFLYNLRTLKRISFLRLIAFKDIDKKQDKHGF